MTLADRVARRLRAMYGVDDLDGITLHWPQILAALMEEDECEICAGGGRC